MNAAPHETEDGPPLARGTQFQPGETVFFSFQVAGYTASPLKQVRLSYRIEAVDPRGIPILEPIDSILDATLHEEDKRWMPKLRAPIPIPSAAPPGTYKINTRITDDISHISVNSETLFEVAGRSLPPAPILALQNFAFHRTEGDTQPLQPPAFRSGDTVFARFDIAGYRYGPENAVDVFYDVAVLNPTGKQIYRLDRAAGDKSSSFYPKPYVPGQMSLTLQPNMRAGEYTVVLTVHDTVGGQHAESRFPFSVE